MVVNPQRYLIRSLVNPLLEYTILSDVKGNLGNKVTAEAVFQKCDDSNANGHRFPKRVLTSALNQIKEEIQNRHFLGELDHPDDINDVNRIATVSLKNVSHVITSLEMDGNYVVGKFETLDTPNGMILGSLLKDKIKIGVSIRAITDQDISYGSNNIDTINEFTLISYDAVHNPAYSDAYVKSVMGSVFKIDGKPHIKIKDRLISLTESELKEIIQSTIMATIRKVYKK
jgi:hypothetical protein